MLCDRYFLPAAAVDQFALLLQLVAQETTSITSVREPMQAVDVHVADSLVALELDDVRSSRVLTDIGAGGGFPGLVLAIALPSASVTLVESVGRKCDFLRRAVAHLELGNVGVVNDRVESWADGRERSDVVTARALAPLAVLLEYAGPLLRVGGSLVAWKGRRDPDEELDGAAAAVSLGMNTPDVRRVAPFAGADERHLYLSSKVSSTPSCFPRRPGMARKRPLRASTGR